LEDGEIASIKTGGHTINKFAAPASTNKLAKLYIIKSGIEIVYVGITSQSVRERLRLGFNAKGEKGYHGYKWKNLSQVEMLVWYFPDSALSAVESVEAEIVYLIRLHSGLWPKHQMEIHFHQSAKNEIYLAEAIYRECMRN